MNGTNNSNGNSSGSRTAAKPTQQQSLLHVLLPVILVSKKDNFVTIPQTFANKLASIHGQDHAGVKALRLGWYAPVGLDVALDAAQNLKKSEENGANGVKDTDEPKGCEAFVGWSGATTTKHHIEIPVDLAESLGIKQAVDYTMETAPGRHLLISVSLTFAPVAKRVDVEPLTPDDWEVLKLDAGFVESNLLSQICVLSPGEIFPVWVHGHSKILLQVTQIHSGGQGVNTSIRLARDTEVAVAPKLRRDPVQDAQGDSLRESDRGPPPKRIRLRVQDLTPPADDTDVFATNVETAAARAAFFASAGASNCVGYLHPSTVELLERKGSWPKVDAQSGRVIRADGGVASLIGWVSADGASKTQRQGQQQVIALRVSTFVREGHVMLPHAVRFRCGVNVLGHCILRLATAPPKQEIPSVIVVRPVVFNHDMALQQTPVAVADVNKVSDRTRMRRTAVDRAMMVKRVEEVKTCLEEVQKAVKKGGDALVVCDKTMLVAKGGKKDMVVMVSIAQEEGSRDNYWLIDDITSLPVEAGTKPVEVRFGLQLPLSTEASRKRTDGAGSNGDEEKPSTDATARFYALPSLNQLEAFRAPAQRMQNRLNPTLMASHVELRIAAGVPIPGGVYLCGNRGSGKTHLLRAVARHYRCTPESLAHTVWVSCAALKGMKRSYIRSVFESAVEEAITQAPSLVILDDLDVLLPAPSGGAESQEDAQTVWLAEWLADLMTQFRDKFEEFEGFARVKTVAEGTREVVNACSMLRVGWVASGKGRRSLRESLNQIGLFDDVVELEPPNVAARAQILESMVPRRREVVAKVDFEEVASLAEGFNVADLRTLTDRALHHYMARMIDSKSMDVGQTTLRHNDYIDALEGYTPASLRGAKLAKSDIKWTDVGGLEGVRQVLKETLELPMLFAPLYERSPVKLASGILLYGPPGCGKTMLAGAVASECGLNFISVKGPEVLDKYIGASEKAVRDLFARAAAAAPCILFFDEFEAIAPRRGNDSTGVTDRVVNQLLTFLDGVESRSGVYVMAASSRPDLIDPALLRPGRLDKQLLCNFPTADEREDILRTVASKMTLTEEAVAELASIARAEKAELFTGADLQAVLYSAQLDQVHAQVPDRAIDEDVAGDAPVVAPETPSIDQLGLLRALESSRPSVSLEERERYNAIYKRFKGERTADFNAVDGYPDGRVGERSALK